MNQGKASWLLGAKTKRQSWYSWSMQRGMLNPYTTKTKQFLANCNYHGLQ